MGSFQEFGRKADDLTTVAKEEAGKVGKEFQTSSKTMKYVVYALVAIAVLALGCCTLKGCGSKPAANTNQTQAVQPQPQQAQAQAAVPTDDELQAEIDREQYQADIRQRQGMSPAEAAAFGAIGGLVIGQMISNGHGGQVAYDGHNGFNDPRYHGKPRSVVINKTYIMQQRAVAPKVATPAVPTKPVAAAPVANPQTTTPTLTPEQQRQKLIADRKAALMKARAVNGKSNFNAMSQQTTPAPQVNPYLAKRQAKQERRMNRGSGGSRPSGSGRSGRR